MLENVFKESSVPGPAGPPPGRRRRSPLPAVLLLPLLLLGLLALIIYLFGWLSFDRRDAIDLAEEVRVAEGERRALAAYELSRLERYDLDPAARGRFLSTLQDLLSGGQESDARVRRSLALTLGRLKDRSSVPALLHAAEDPDTETQIYALWSLGAIGDPAALDALSRGLQSEDAAVRKTAAFALGQLGERAAAPSLRVALQDASPDVAWNAAVALGRLGDEAGLVVLLPIVTGEMPARDLPPAQWENLRINAIRSLRGWRSPVARAALQRAASSDASPRIQTEARLALDGQSPPPSYSLTEVASPR